MRPYWPVSIQFRAFWRMPPAIPSEWIELADRLPQEPDSLAPAAFETSEGPVEVDAQYAELIKETDHVD